MLDVEPSETRAQQVVVRVRFDEGDRSRLYVGSVSLRRYLETSGLKWVLRLGELMDEMDWAAFERAYEPGGRPPLHPKRVLGLMMYAAVLQQSSLRQTETLALRDVGAWWLTGGLAPDHTTIARFVARHEALLSDDFFVQVTSKVAKHLGATSSEMAIDGTVKEAASSAVRALKREALDRKRAEAKEELEVAQAAVAKAASTEETAVAAAQEEEAAERVEQLEKANEVMAQREEANKVVSKPTDNLQVSVVEPEAALQPLKQSNDYGLAYKCVCGANGDGLIVAQQLAPTSETEHVEELLEQHERVLGHAPERVLADAGFSSIALLSLFVALGIDVLIPSGKNGKPRSGRGGRFGKSVFGYDEASDSMRCPHGAVLTPGKPQKDRRGLVFRKFSTSACSSCPLRAQCTKATARIIKRYDGDELKDAMENILRHPAAKAAYKRRSAMVEPVFARMAQAGFTRFRRRGLIRVRTEWALRCASHNIALFLGRWRGVVFAIFAIRLPDGSWRRSIAVASVTP